jgi:excisionase family DNA binding protein
MMTYWHRYGLLLTKRSRMMYNVFDMKDKLITVREAASLLGVNPETLRRWDRKGKVNAKRHPINNYRLYSKLQIQRLRSDIHG